MESFFEHSQQSVFVQGPTFQGINCEFIDDRDVALTGGRAGIVPAWLNNSLANGANRSITIVGSQLVIVTGGTAGDFEEFTWNTAWVAPIGNGVAPAKTMDISCIFQVGDPVNTSWFFGFNRIDDLTPFSTRRDGSAILNPAGSTGFNLDAWSGGAQVTTLYNGIGSLGDTNLHRLRLQVLPYFADPTLARYKVWLDGSLVRDTAPTDNLSDYLALSQQVLTPCFGFKTGVGSMSVAARTNKFSWLAADSRLQ